MSRNILASPSLLMETRICSKCKARLPIAQFSWKDKSKKQRLYRCKACDYARIVRRRYEIRKKLFAYLTEHPCMDCGESDIVVLQFDHVSSDKTANVSKLVGQGYGWSTIEKEIQKCEVVCANCHARRTAQQWHWLKCGEVSQHGEGAGSWPQ